MDEKDKEKKVHGIGRSNCHCDNCDYSEYDKKEDSLWCRRHKQWVESDDLCDDWKG